MHEPMQLHTEPLHIVIKFFSFGTDLVLYHLLLQLLCSSYAIQCSSFLRHVQVDFQVELHPGKSTTPLIAANDSVILATLPFAHWLYS